MAGSVVAAIECPICFDFLKNPVATPCGHLCCSLCLDMHIQHSDEPFKSTCPTCRVEFPIVTPILEHVPEKYREFIGSPVRRVYLPGGDEIEDLQRLADERERLLALASKLERDKQDLQREKQDLHARHTSALDAARRYQLGEQLARRHAQDQVLEVNALRRQVAELQLTLQQVSSASDARRAQALDPSLLWKKNGQNVHVGHQTLPVDQYARGGVDREVITSNDAHDSQASTSREGTRPLKRTASEMDNIAESGMAIPVPKRLYLSHPLHPNQPIAHQVTSMSAFDPSYPPPNYVRLPQMPLAYSALEFRAGEWPEPSLYTHNFEVYANPDAPHP